MGSMHTGLEVRDDGGAALAAFYRERVDGGAGLIITGGLAVDSMGRGGPDYAVLGEPAVQKNLTRAVRSVHDGGGLIAAQLFHAGRYAILDGELDAEGQPAQSVAPSGVPWRAARGVVPRALDDAGVWATIASFAAAAIAAVDAGFDAVEIMASEGYLLNQFCSSLTNLRDDEWGGDSPRRRRFAIEVLRAVRAALPAAIPVTVRVSGDDLMPGSSTPDEVDALVLDLVASGADAVSVGVGWHESTVPTVQTTVPHGAWLACAERIARVLRSAARTVPVIASNRITDLRDVERVLERGTVDAVALARPFLADARIIERSLRGEFTLVNSCIGCDQACIDRSLVFQPVSCLVNPRAGSETEFPDEVDPVSLRIAVIGAGPAGLSAAVDLARRGHAVTLFEAGKAGGQFQLAARIPGKEDYALTVSTALAVLAQHGADLLLGTRATIDDLHGFDGVLLASGVHPRDVDIPGADLPHVRNYEQALLDGVPEGSVAIIGGGGIGVDLATYLIESHDPRMRAKQFSARHGLGFSTAELSSVRDGGGDGIPARAGALVSVLRRSGKFGQGIGITSRWVALAALREAGVRMLSDLDYRAITPEGVEIVRDGEIELIRANTVVICAGQIPEDTLAADLAGAGIPHEVIGGARDARHVDAVRATREGLEAARRLTTALARGGVAL
jgi:2,4-dienoyl-CoA reductase (NADPH2)